MDARMDQNKPAMASTPATYSPAASQRSVVGRDRPSRTKHLPLPPPPRSPWPMSAEQQRTLRVPRRTRTGMPLATPPRLSRSVRQNGHHIQAFQQSKDLATLPPRQGTMRMARPPRPTVVGYTMERPRAVPRRPSQSLLRAASPPPVPPVPLIPPTAATRRPSEPTLKYSERQRVPAETHESRVGSSPPPRQHLRRPSAPRSQSSLSSLSTLVSQSPPPPPSYFRPEEPLQTRYMSMLLSLSTIPRLHNILASLFSFLLLAGFITLPYISSSLVLLGISIALLVLGGFGTIYFLLVHRRNDIWLLNRLFLPGILNSLAGLIATFTSVYAQYGGRWSPSANVAFAAEGASLVLFVGLFGVYDFLLLKRAKREHGLAVKNSGGGGGGILKQRSLAPGSVV